MKMDKESFKEIVRGKETGFHIIENNRIRAAITSYGARIVALWVKNKKGHETDVVVGFDSIRGYLRSTETYYSAIIGRYANRIARGRFSLNGKVHQLSINNEPNHLHGGPFGFHNQVWDFDELTASTARLSYFSEDGEENYPGNLKVTVTYYLSDNGIVISYEATTDQTTIINLTSHPFFNLNGQGSGTICDHVLQIDADHYNPVDEALIPTGIDHVESTPFDFRKPARINEKMDEQNQQLKYGHGYDHNMVLNGNGFRKVAEVKGNLSGIVMEVHTDQPGMQLYSGNYMKGENAVKYGHLDKYREAFCLETQHFPDAPNQPAFPSTKLEPGQVFTSKTEYRFS